MDQKLIQMCKQLLRVTFFVLVNLPTNSTRTGEPNAGAEVGTVPPFRADLKFNETRVSSLFHSIHGTGIFTYIFL